jgi:hypothetical protein
MNGMTPSNGELLAMQVESKLHKKLEMMDDVVFQLEQRIKRLEQIIRDCDAAGLFRGVDFTEDGW